MTLASRIMGLLREITRAKFLGTSMFADAFTTAFMIPNLLRRLFAENSISAAFIPTFKEYLQKNEESKNSETLLLKNKQNTQDFLNSTFTLLSFSTCMVVILGIILSPFITPLFCKMPDASAINYTELLQEYNLKLSEMTLLTRIMFPYLFVISMAALFQGILNGCNIFSPSGFTPVLFNLIVIIATYALSPYTQNPARAMSIGVIVGGTIQALFQWPFIKQTGWKVTFITLKNTFNNPGTRKVLRLIAPTIIGMAAYQLNDVVSTSLANRAGVGIASSLQYSLRLQELVLGIFAVSIGTVILPDLSSLSAKKDYENFNNMLLSAIKIMTLISIPVTFYSFINGKELITLLYKSKSFDEKSVLLTLGEFRYHMLGLLFIALNRIIASAFYAQKAPKLPTLAGIFSFIANILCALILVRPMRGNGIALALTIASLVNTIFLFIFMTKMEAMNVFMMIKGTILYSLKIIIFSVVASIPCYFLHPILIEKFASYTKIVSQGLPLLINFVIFAVIGLIQLLITKDKSIMVILRKIKK